MILKVPMGLGFGWYAYETLALTEPFFSPSLVTSKSIVPDELVLVDLVTASLNAAGRPVSSVGEASGEPPGSEGSGDVSPPVSSLVGSGDSVGSAGLSVMSVGVGVGEA